MANEAKPPYSRTRERKTNTTIVGSVTGIYHPNPAWNWGPVAVSADKATGYYQVMRDVVTPGWRDLVSKGHIVNNPMFSHYEIYKSAIFNGSEVSNDATGENITTNDALGRRLFGPVRKLSEHSIDSLVNQAVVQARSEIEKPDVLAIVSAMELPKTLDMLAQTADRLYQFARAARGKRLTRAQAERLLGKRIKRTVPVSKIVRETSDYATSNWLEYRYGWMPLVYDIQGWTAALSQQKKLPRKTARGRAQRSWNHSADDPGLTTWDRDWPHKITQYTDFVVRAYVLYEVDYSVLHRIQSFGVAHLPLSMWELVPLSFVADWFVGVGDWLEAMQPRVGVTELAIGYSTMEGTTLSRMYRTSVPHSTGPGAFPPSDGLTGREDVDISIRKYRVTTFPTMVYPPLRVNLNKQRVIDGISLLVGAIPRSARI